MNMRTLILLVIFCINLGFASEFPMGDASKSWGVRVDNNDEQFKLKLGTRIQAIAKQVQTTDNNNDQTHNSDFYVRRMRLMLEVKYTEGWKFYADIRNDDVGKEDKGEQDFNIGDAFLEKKLSDTLKLRLLRAKVDVARTQTVSSARLLFLNRASIADHAAQYVSHNRRAANAQILGQIGEKVNYQLVIGDGVYSQKFYDAFDNRPDDIISQNAMIGGKIRVSPFKDAQDKKLKEAYFGKEKVISFGLGVFNTSQIKIDNGTDEYTTSRTLYNLEATYHRGPLTILAEAFKFDGEFYDLSASDRIGSSDGYIIQGEYCLENYYAPFLRLETWDRFNQEDDMNQKSYVLGVNRYLKGEKFRYGLFYTHDQFEKNIGDETVETLQLSMMMNY
jgi:phosphate-selective porin